MVLYNLEFGSEIRSEDTTGARRVSRQKARDGIKNIIRIIGGVNYHTTTYLRGIVSTIEDGYSLVGRSGLSTEEVGIVR